MTQDFHALAVAALDSILARGFTRPTFATLPEKLMFVVTELDEVHHDMLHGATPDTELVDVVLRLLGCLEGVWPGEWSDRGEKRVEQTFDRPAELLWPIMGWLTKAAQAWRDNREIDTRIALEYALRDAWSLLRKTTFGSAYQMCVAKIEANASRPVLNGHARST